MTDPETQAFHVVDRRRSAQPTETQSSSDSVPDVPADTSSAPLNTSSDSSQGEGTSPMQPETPVQATETPSGEAEGTTDSDAGEDGMPMPDPGALLAYVAMQMDVKTLATSLLGVFSGQAWRAMGLVASPVTGQTEKNLPEAQIAIDCFQFLLGKLDADIKAEDRRELQRRLNDLRVNYLAKMRES